MYDAVNQVAESYASKSAAISDWAVVIIEIFVAKNNGMLARVGSSTNQPQSP